MIVSDSRSIGFLVKRPNSPYQAIPLRTTTGNGHRYQTDSLHLYASNVQAIAKCKALANGNHQARVYLKVRSGIITSSNISISSNQDVAQEEAERVGRFLKERNIQEIRSFGNFLNKAACQEKEGEIAAISSWLDSIFGKGNNPS